MRKKRQNPHSQPEQEMAVQVATLSALYEWLGRPKSVVYISIPNDESGRTLPFKDPGEELILALFGEDIDARPLSESKTVEGYFVDPATGDQTYLLGVQQIGWSSPNEAQVKALFFKGNRWGSTFSLRLRSDGTAWRVEEMRGTGMF